MNSDSPNTADIVESALHKRDADAAECPIQKRHWDVCPRCKATTSDACGLITSADYAFVETVRAALKDHRKAQT